MNFQELTLSTQQPARNGWRLKGARVSVASLLLFLPALWSAQVLALEFTDVSEASGAAWVHDVVDDYEDPGELPTPVQMGGGVAAGDVDNDGDTDLYLVTGSAYANVLLINDGRGGFTDRAVDAGVALSGEANTAPVFADLNADGLIDLIVGGVMGSGMKAFRNLGDLRFEEMTGYTAIPRESDLQSDSSFGLGDPDGDGDLDLYTGHWGASRYINHYWINAGDGQFVPADEQAGVVPIYEELDWSFAPTFTDFTGDGRQDLLITSDFQTSHTLVNVDGVSFTNTTTDVIDDKSGMGSATGDFDNDGDMDWFVTSIFYGDATPGQGNRLYVNDGTGTFTNETESAGVLEGDWGWSACAADFNNDGWLDLFHVNGMYFTSPFSDFTENTSKLFLNQGDGTFAEQAESLGISDSAQGRGLVCFDADLDGDIDIFTANVFGSSSLFRNELQENPGWLQVSLQGEDSNPSAVGAIIRVTVGEVTQTREVIVGSNYQSQNPLTQHFGLGGAERIDRLEIAWPHGGTTVLTDLERNQRLSIEAQSAQPAPLQLQPGHSAAWYDSQRNGEGFLLEMLDNNRVVLYWFTYDRAGEQDWYLAVGEVNGRRIVFPELLRVSGGEFGTGFDNSKIVREVVGTAAFTWQDCSTAVMDWTLKPGLSANGMGRQQLTRLTGLAGLGCNDPGEAPDPVVGPVPVTGPAALSGAWYDPSHDGEGFVLEMLSDTSALVFWFSFDAQGQRRWFYNVGELQGETIVFEEIVTTRGGLFGKAFDPDQVETLPWGRLELELNCQSGTARWSASETGFADGALNLQRLTRLRGLSC